MRKHVDLATIKREAAKRAKQRQTRTDKGEDEDKSMEDESDKPDSEEKSDEKEDTDEGKSTDESDESNSDHVTPGKKAKACRLKRQSMPIDLLPGALVMIPNNSRHIGLRGILGQIISAGRFRIQLAPQLSRDALTCQLIELAYELGMIVDDFVVIHKSNYAMVLKAKKAYMEMGMFQKDFSANSIFDSDSELLLTGCKGILRDYRQLCEPVIAEGVLAEVKQAQEKALSQRGQAKLGYFVSSPQLGLPAPPSAPPSAPSLAPFGCASQPERSAHPQPPSGRTQPEPPPRRAQPADKRSRVEAEIVQAKLEAEKVKLKAAQACKRARLAKEAAGC